jgi:hypothetical protein
MKTLTDIVLELGNEGLTAKSIALKLGIEQDAVEDILEAPGNYLNEEQQKNILSELGSFG